MKAELALPENLSIIHLLAVLVGLVVADGLISQAIMEHGLGREGNPFLFGLAGPSALLIKTAGGLVAALVLWDVHKKKPRASLAATLFSLTVYTAIVFWNVGVYALARQV